MLQSVSVDDIIKLGKFKHWQVRFSTERNRAIIMSNCKLEDMGLYNLDYLHYICHHFEVEEIDGELWLIVYIKK